MTLLDRVIQAALSYEAASMSEPHANYDAELELREDGLVEAIQEYVTGNWKEYAPFASPSSP